MVPDPLLLLREGVATSGVEKGVMRRETGGPGGERIYAYNVVYCEGLSNLYPNPQCFLSHSSPTPTSGNWTTRVTLRIDIGSASS